MDRALIAMVAVQLVASAAAQAPAGWNDLGSEFQEGLTDPWRLAPVELPALLAPGSGDEVPDELVEAWIDALAETDYPGPGYSPYSDAAQFLPWPELRSMGAWLLPTAPLEANDALRRLEELGPRALPHLLAHLDDPRPTRLFFDSEDRYSTQRLDRRVHGNPLNEREAAALGEWIVDRWSSAPTKPSCFEADYGLRVGDLCFVALGQIANRPHYAAIRYGPSGHAFITSPVEDPELAEMLRAAWGGDEPRRMLWESLLLDFHTRGQHTSTLQAGAAARLAYYFPDSAAPLLARRLDELQSEDGWDPAARFHNGIYVDYLLDALCPCEHPLVAAAWQRALTRQLLARPVDAEVEAGTLLWRRFVSAWERGEDETAFEALRASHHLGPEDAAPMHAEALADPDPVRLARTCHLLARAPGDRSHAIEPLQRLLQDRRPGGSSYVTAREGGLVELCVAGGALSWRIPSALLDAKIESSWVDREVEGLRWNELGPSVPVFSALRLPLRVCDEAAIALACITGRFLDLQTDHAGLDAQVRAWELRR